jgi:hypothetical protein
MFKVSDAKTPEEYIDRILEPRKSEMETLHKLIINTVPNLKPFMIAGMIGYGKYHYKSKSGREGEWCTIALASQKNYISVYVCAVDENGLYLAEQNKQNFSTNKDKFSKVSIGKSCIRFKKTADINLDELKKLLVKAEKIPLSAV